MTDKEMEQRLLARKIALNAIELDERSVDEKLADIEVMAEDFKDRRAAEEVDQFISRAKKEGDGSMFEDPPENEKEKFSWEKAIGEID